MAAMIDSIQISIVVAIIAIVAVFFYLLPRYGPHKKSILTCSKCNKQFTYHWVPGASWASLRGSKRKLRCPHCHQISTFDLAAAKSKKTKSPANVKKQSK